MSVVRYRKRPTVVDTIQWTGINVDDLIDFTGGNFLLPDRCEQIFSPEFTAKVWDAIHDTWVRMKTGQHVVRGIQGELYPIAEDALAETYELVDGAFFEPGRSYTSTGPRDRWLRFVCEHVTRDPQTGVREAWGWLHRADGTRRMERAWDSSYPQWTAE
ncbi:hypothetical protein PV383_19715 [Streptomyces caniscabiei]|uniref:Uncharacterized protein n=1 Tax=Streptomyces caniscabiei TaxID=2746961 RepID=A0ABU4MS89_9ACTN|nr:hypothetical protein [Streptomyces caniscabiei]MDX3039387.1 hypothetical protein [Streptomyces caniscabiei]